MLDNKFSLKNFIIREFFKAALLPLLIIGIALIAMYFGINAYNNGKFIKTLKKESISYLEEIVDNQALIISEQLRSITSLSNVLQKETKRFFENPDRFPKSSGQAAFEFASNGVYFKSNNNNGCSLFYSTLHPIGSKEKNKAARSEALDPLYRNIFHSNRNIVAVYLNTFDTMCRYYPFIDKVNNQFAPDTNVQDFNFYYLADAKHNPECKPVWTEAYLDPAGLGWMMSCIAPIYRDNFLEGVAGIDITVERFIDNILNLELPWDSHAFIVDSQGKIIAKPHEIENVLGLKELRKHIYSGKALQDTYKPEELNLIKSKLTGVAGTVSRLMTQKSGIADLTIGDHQYLLAQKNVKETGGKLMVLTDKAKIFNPINLLARNANRIGYAAICLMAVFYCLFFCYLLRNTRKISSRIAEPVSEISRASIRLVAGEHGVQLSQCGIEEIDELSRNFEKMALDLKNFHDNLEMEVERANKAAKAAKQAEGELGKHRDHLEELVETRATELTESNEMLKQDIVKRKSVEQALDIERRQLLSIFDSIDEDVYVSDPDSYELLYINEVVKKHKKDNSLEFRLKIDHGKFLKASQKKANLILLEALERSVDKMSTMDVVDEDISFLHSVLSEVKKEV